jgi:hypothetical protein
MRGHQHGMNKSREYGGRSYGGKNKSDGSLH